MHDGITFEEKLSQFLKTRSDENRRRRLSNPNVDAIDFCSNDYLGLARSEELFQSIHQRLLDQGLHNNGSSGSRLLSGNSAYAEIVENKLAGIFKGASALLFNSGYTANLSVLSSIPEKNDTIIYDERAHASIKDGARLSIAKRYAFRHNDLEDLEQKIKRSTGQVFVVVESVYSMDGDECPLPELVALTEKYNANIILDEAHSTGVCGEHGNGISTTLGLDHKIAVRIYTFGKAMGIHGACVIGSAFLKDYLINAARPFIYTTAPPPVFLASIDAAFDFLDKNIHLQTILQERIQTFNTHAACIRGFNPMRYAIQALVIPGNENVKQVASALIANNFDVRPIVSPTVPQGTERLRICVHVYNTENEIIQLIESLKQLNNE